MDNQEATQGGGGYKLVMVCGLILAMMAVVAFLILPGIMQLSADSTARTAAQAAIAQAHTEAAQREAIERTERARLDAQTTQHAADLRAETLAAQAPIVAVVALVVVCGLVVVVIIAALGWRDRQRAALVLALQDSGQPGYENLLKIVQTAPGGLLTTHRQEIRR